MQDRIVEFPNRYRATKVTGTDDVYDLTPVPGAVSSEGTFLSKENLLSDETAASLGLDSNATVNDAFGQTASKAALTSHTSASDIHVTAQQKTAWTAKQNALTFDTAPTQGSTNPVTSGGVYTALQNGGKSPYVYTFAASAWTSGSSESTLTIPAATHGITGSAVLYNFSHLVNGAYLPGTWACIESWAEINASTHVITLHGPSEGYAGRVTLYG